MLMLTYGDSLKRKLAKHNIVYQAISCCIVKHLHIKNNGKLLKLDLIRMLYAPTLIQFPG